MTQKTDFDVIILGAGISGLLLGSQLSERHSVLVLEKESNIPHNKYWLTNLKCIKNSPELRPFIESFYSYLDFVSCYGKKYRCFGEYVLWDSNKLLSHLASKIEKEGGIILKNTLFYRYVNNCSYVELHAGNKAFTAKLIIDCMGYMSPIIYAKDMIEIYGYYALYGKILNTVETIDPIGLGNIFLHKSPMYFEVFPRNDQTAYTILICPQRQIRKNQRIHEEFNFLVTNSEYSKYFDAKSEDCTNLHGIIPVGRLKRSSLERIFLFGESGQFNPATTATCLTHLLYSYKVTAEEISKRIYNDKLDANSLAAIVNSVTNMNKEFQLSLFKDILDWNSDKFDTLIQMMITMDNNLVYDIIFGEVKIGQLMTKDNLLNLLINKNHIVLKPLIKAFLAKTIRKSHG